MAQDGGNSNNNYQSPNWYRLTPNSAGSYVNGSWSGLATMNLPRRFFPTVMLPDGRVLAVGGEYSNLAPNANDTNMGEIFDPLGGVGGVGRWTAIRPVPSPMYGDDPMEVLSPTQVLTGDISNANSYLFTPPAMGITGPGMWMSPPTAKLNMDESDEETWVKLPDGSILSYSIWSSINAISSTNPNPFQAQRHVPANTAASHALGVSNVWVDASNLNTSSPQGASIRPSDGPPGATLKGG